MVEVLHIVPKDLWPNADMFYKQIVENKLREHKGKIPAIIAPPPTILLEQHHPFDGKLADEDVDSRPQTSEGGGGGALTLSDIGEDGTPDTPSRSQQKLKSSTRKNSSVTARTNSARKKSTISVAESPGKK